MTGGPGRETPTILQLSNLSAEVRRASRLPSLFRTTVTVSRSTQDGRYALVFSPHSPVTSDSSIFCQCSVRVQPVIITSPLLYLPFPSPLTQPRKPQAPFRDTVRSSRTTAGNIFLLRGRETHGGPCFWCPVLVFVPPGAGSVQSSSSAFPPSICFRFFPRFRISVLTRRPARRRHPHTHIHRSLCFSPSLAVFVTYVFARRPIV